jgi:hypothetical protein
VGREPPRIAPPRGRMRRDRGLSEHRPVRMPAGPTRPGGLELFSRNRSAKAADRRGVHVRAFAIAVRLFAGEALELDDEHGRHGASPRARARPLVGGVEVRQARAHRRDRLHPMPLDFQSAQKASHAVAPTSHV